MTFEKWNDKIKEIIGKRYSVNEVSEEKRRQMFAQGCTPEQFAVSRYMNVSWNKVSSDGKRLLD